MSDQANIINYLARCKYNLKSGEYLEAAINAYWCIQYCINGEPYGMSGENLRKAHLEAEMILGKATKKIKNIPLSKTTFVYGTICPKLLWLHKNKYDARRISEETQRKFDYGHNIGRIAQKLFPGGVDASIGNCERTIDMTPCSLPFYLKQHLWIEKTAKQYMHNTIYEAAFVYDDVFAAVDILKPSELGHIAYEVKSSVTINDTIISDCALQYYVLSHNCKLEDFFLIYINEDYFKEIEIPLDQVMESNVDIHRLFVVESVLSKILPLQNDIRKKLQDCKATLRMKGEPKIKMGKQCSSPYDCMYSYYCKNEDSIRRFKFSFW